MEQQKTLAELVGNNDGVEKQENTGEILGNDIHEAGCQGIKESEAVVGEGVQENTNGNNLEETSGILIEPDEPELPNFNQPEENLHSGGPLSNLSKYAENATEEAEKRKRTEQERIAEDKKYEVNEEELQKLTSKKNSFNDVVSSCNDYTDEESNDDEGEEAALPKKPIIDLTSIKIKKVKNSSEEYNKIKKKKSKLEPITQVVNPNSGYLAQYKGFSSSELRRIPKLINELDTYRGLNLKLTKLWEKLDNTNVGKLSYDAWLKATSVLEINNIYYAVFCSTNPDTNQYPHVCEHCKKKFTFEYHNNNLLMLDGHPSQIDETREKIIHIVNDIENAMNYYGNSKVNELTRKYLEGSGNIVEIRHPSLWNELKEIVQKLPPALDNEDIIAILTYIENMYVPVTPGDPETEYIQLESIEDMYEELSNLKEADDIALSEAVNEIVDTNNIIYGFKNVECPHCHEMQKPIIIESMESLLFTMHQIKTMLK